MSAKNKKSLKLIIAALVVTLSSVFLPTMGAYADVSGGGEEKAKNYLYAAAMESCLRKMQSGSLDYLNTSVTYGENLSSIINSGVLTDGDLSVYIGKWLGNENGRIGCKEVFDKTAEAKVGSTGSSINSDFLNEGGLLNGVYEESSDATYSLTCHYIIVNSEHSGYLIGDDGYAKFYTWPQGFYEDSSGNLQSGLNASPIAMKYDSGGNYLGHEGGESGINPNIDATISSHWSIGGGADARCGEVLRSYDMMIYPSGTDESGATSYTNILYTTDDRPIDRNDENRAVFIDIATGGLIFNQDTADTFFGQTQQVAGADRYITLATGTTSELVTQMIINLETIYFDGMAPSNYLNFHPDVKYMILGRYLFNGDGALTGKNCGGVSVLEDDPNISSLNQATWNIGLSYIASIQAYIGTNKAGIRTKFGGDAGVEEGEDRSFAPYPTDSAPVLESCKSKAAEFSELSIGSSLVKNVVYGYINPSSIGSNGGVPTPYNPSNPGSVDTTEVNCYTNAGALGWILCPITEGGRDFVSGIYDKFIEPQLVLDSGLFLNRDQGGNQGGEETYQAWQTFRNLANIAFVAVFLFVIFSQLTGFGIDNYGIKKILPKMIVAAIIVNASYYICQVAIDVANIAGHGIKNIMGRIGTIPEASEFAIQEGGHVLANIGSSVGIGALVLALAAPAVLGQGIGVLVTVFTALIGIIVAILTLFVVLAARKALSLVLVVISPLALLCYMLPNTKKLFDKWLNAMKGTLLAFPICAAMVFGGQAVSRIVMLASSEVEGTPFFMTLIAAATAVAPIFLIPSVLKKSMGAVSAVIDKASHGVNRFAKGRWQGSRTAKNMRETGASWAKQRASGLRFDKEGNVVGYTRRGMIQNRLPRTASSRRRLQAERLAAINESSAEMAAGERFGDLGYYSDISEAKTAAIKKESYERELERNDANFADDMIKNSASGGKIDMDALEAAIPKVGGMNQEQLLKDLQVLTATDAFKNMGEKDKNRFLRLLNSQDNTVLKSYAKVLGGSTGNHQSINDAKLDIAKKIAENKDNNLAVNTDKDVLKWMAGEGMADAFNSEQIKALMTSNIGGGQAESAAEIIRKRNATNLRDELSGLTEDQIGNTRDIFLKAASENAGLGASGVRAAIGEKVQNIYHGENEQLKSKLTQSKIDNILDSQHKHTRANDNSAFK